MHFPTRTVRFQQVAAIAMALAGVLHLVIAPAHWGHAPAHGLFFLISGLAEIAWAAVYMRRATLKLSLVGLVMAVGLIMLWGLSRVLPAPFGHGPEEVDAAGLICKLTEAVGALVLARVVFQAYLASLGRSTAWRALLVVVVASLALGGLGYGAARASQPLLPVLAAVEDDDHGHDEVAWTEAEPVSASELAERFGVHVTQIAVSGMGGLIDFRFKVLDPEKANAMMQDHEQMPRLVVEDSGIVLTATEGMRHSYRANLVYYMFYPNTRNAVTPGAQVSVVIGDARLEHLIAQ